MKTYLFQGDSITDAGRSRENDAALGHGYPGVMAANLGAKYPGEYNFLNRGISGNRIVDLYARIKIDIINLKPDYMSILIGVNDVWHEIARENGVDAEKFEKIYTMLIDEVLEALPDIKIIIMSPYVLSGTATDEALDTFRSEVKKRAEVAKKIAEKYSFPFIDLYTEFDNAQKLAPADFWLADGVHPKHAGHGLIAKLLAEKFEEIR